MMAVDVTAIILVCASFALWPIPASFGGFGALVFWTAMTLVASASPVPMPRGTFVSVSIAPILAAAALGGPSAAAVVAAVGTTEWREIRGEIPWYGSAYNHAALVVPAVAAALVPWALVGTDFAPTVLSFAALAIAGLVYFGLNVTLASALAALRRHRSVSGILVEDIRLVGGNLLGMAPLAWLIAASWQYVWWSALVFALPLYTNRRAYQQTADLRSMFEETLEALTSAIDARDPATKNHSKKVQEIAVAIGLAMHCSEADLETLAWGGLLHDIGKIGIGDSILLKPDRLTRDERILMNTHPEMGADIIRSVTRLKAESELIRHHHEWYNGSGYPGHLVGEEVPKLARIVHVADAYEAMTTERPYHRKPLTPEQALGELRKFAGIQFDPAVVDAFAMTRFAESLDPSTGPGAPPPVSLLAKAASLRARPADSGDLAGHDAG
jgi:putative nucleotidyltransferase with HDIG domain